MAGSHFQCQHYNARRMQPALHLRSAWVRFANAVSLTFLLSFLNEVQLLKWRREKALSIPDFALFSALAYESEDAWGHTGFLYERHEMGLKPSAFVPRVRCF